MGELVLIGIYVYIRIMLKNVLVIFVSLCVLDLDYVLFGVEEINMLIDVILCICVLLVVSWVNDCWLLSSWVNCYGSVICVFNFGDGYFLCQIYGVEWQLDVEVEFRIMLQWSVVVGGQNLIDNYFDFFNDDIYYFGNLLYDVLLLIGSNGVYFYGCV